MLHTLPKTSFRLQHDLNPHFKAIKSFTSRQDYESSAMFREFQDEISRVEQGLAWHNQRTSAETGKSLKVVAWNIERGQKIRGIIELLASREELKDADVLLISECDIGMARSGNRDIPAEIADALDMNYCYANSFIVLGPGDLGEQHHLEANTLALHGVAIFSRYPIKSAASVALPKVKDVFLSSEKRLGSRRALVCEIDIAGTSWAFAVAHLDVQSSPFQRAQQVKAILNTLDSSTAEKKMIGGDFNTSTYALNSKWALTRDLLYKACVTGFRGTIAHYMRPDHLFDKPVFDMLHAYQYDVEPFNDLETGTCYYDVNSDVMRLKSMQYVPSAALAWLRRRLQPWNGFVPIRLDWLAGSGLHRELAVGNPRTFNLELPFLQNFRVSDHNPIACELPLIA